MRNEPLSCNIFPNWSTVLVYTRELLRAYRRTETYFDILGEGYGFRRRQNFGCKKG